MPNVRAHPPPKAVGCGTLLGRLALLPFNDVVDLEDCWLRLDTQALQDRHELRAEGVKLGLTFEDVYHL